MNFDLYILIERIFVIYKKMQGVRYSLVIYI